MANKNNSSWDTYASLYDKIQGETGDVAHRLIYDPEINELIGSVDGKRVLDAGCGNGCWTRRLAKNAVFVTGIDSSAQLIKVAKSKTNPDNVDYKVQDLMGKLDFKDKSFDLILSSMVLHYMASLTDTVAELSRILKDNGEVVICVQHPIYQYHYRAQATAGKVSTAFPHTIGYFDKTPVEQVTLFGKAKLLTYNRTIEDYISLFTKHHFVLTDLREPQFTDEFIRIMPRYKDIIEIPRVIILKFRRIALDYKD